MMKRHVSGMALLGVSLAVFGASAANVGVWVGELPKKLASGADVPALETTGPRSIFVPGDFARFEQVWARLDKGEPIRIAVIGGSITQGAGASRPERRWGESFCAGWRRAFPNARIDFVNAGIGATGSEIGAFRLKRDVLDKKPDVVVVEFAVNDRKDKDRAESYEGVVRQLLKEPRGIAVILLGQSDDFDHMPSRRVLAQEERRRVPPPLVAGQGGAPLRLAVRQLAGRALLSLREGGDDQVVRPFAGHGASQRHGPCVRGRAAQPLPGGTVSGVEGLGARAGADRRLARAALRHAVRQGRVLSDEGREDP